MERKGCGDLIDPLPEFKVANPRPDPRWLLLLLLIPVPGNPLYGGL
jgi:hypothetical protein